MELDHRAFRIAALAPLGGLAVFLAAHWIATNGAWSEPTDPYGILVPLAFWVVCTALGLLAAVFVHKSRCDPESSTWSSLFFLVLLATVVSWLLAMASSRNPLVFLQGAATAMTAWVLRQRQPSPVSSARRIPSQGGFSRDMFIASIGLYTICLFNDCIQPASGSFQGWVNGCYLLIWGWLAILNGVIAWLANPALWIAWALSAMKQPKLSALFAGISLALMLSFLFQGMPITDPEGHQHIQQVAHYGMGYGLWIASAVALLAGAFLASDKRHRPSSSH